VRLLTFAFCLVPFAFLEGQSPAQFRTGVELVTVDLIATDSSGLPITDLKPGDLTLKVDGKNRPIQSLQFVKLSDPTRAPQAIPAAAAPALPSPFASNTDPVARSFIFVIGHELIHPGNERPSIDAARRFLDRLQPEDRVGLITMPRGKVEADLSTDRAAVRKALDGITGHAPRRSSRFEFSTAEAFAAFNLRNGSDLDRDAVAEMKNRECSGSSAERVPCEAAVVGAATDFARELKNTARDTVRGLTELIGGLSAIEGTKSIVFVAEGLPTTRDELLDMEDLGRAADLARVRMFVVQANRPLYDIGRRKAPADEAGDIAFVTTGLESVAGVTGGELFRPSAGVDAVLTKINNVTSAFYLLAFEPTEKERDGKYHKLQVTMSRPGVTLRARSGFQIANRAESALPASAAPLAGLLRDNLRTYRDLPLRAAAFSFRDTTSDQIKVLVLADSPGGGTLSSAAFALINEGGGRGAEWAADANEIGGATVVTAGAVPEGRYRARVAASDTLGRRGVVDVPLTAELVELGAAPSVVASSLMPGVMANGGFQPRLSLAGAGAITGFLELYNVPLLGGSPTVRLELAATPDGPALASAEMTVATAAPADRRIARGTVTVPATAPTGDLILRATVSLDGRTLGSLTRTIRR
jgi:VWFA-related protein